MMDNGVASWPVLRIQRTRNQCDREQSKQEPTHRTPPSSGRGPNAVLLLWVLRVWPSERGESFADRASDFANRASSFRPAVAGHSEG